MGSECPHNRTAVITGDIWRCYDCGLEKKCEHRPSCSGAVDPTTKSEAKDCIGYAPITNIPDGRRVVTPVAKQRKAKK